MKLTTSNYIDATRGVNISALPGSMQSIHKELIMGDLAKNEWKAYHGDPEVRETVDMFFANMEKLWSRIARKEDEAPPAPPKPVKKPAKKRRVRAKRSTATKPAPPAPKPDVEKKEDKKPARKKSAAQKKPKEPKAPKLPELPAGVPVDLVASDVALAKKYVALHGKTKEKKNILSLVHGLQKAALEHRVSTDREPVKSIQKELLEALGLMPEVGKVKFEIAPDRITYYRSVADGSHMRKSTALLKQFVSLTGKTGKKLEAKKLATSIEKWEKVIPADDPNKSFLAKAAAKLFHYANTPGVERVEVEPVTLAGIGNLAVGDDGLGRISNRRTGAIALRLLDAKVKNLKAPELRRAFRKTKAPALCLAIAQRLVELGDLTIDAIRKPGEPHVRSKKKVAISAASRKRATASR
jgi:hypothetical protein